MLLRKSKNKAYVGSEYGTLVGYGYVTGQKGYRVLLNKSKKVLTSQNVAEQEQEPTSDWFTNSITEMIIEDCFGSDSSDDESPSSVQQIQGRLIDPPRDPRLVDFVDMSSE